MRIRNCILILFAGILSSCSMNAQELIPIFKVKGSFVEDGWLIIPELQLKRGKEAKLYHQDKLCFAPEGNYALCSYEVFNDKYIVITPIDKSKKENSAIFIMPKRDIKIYSLSSQKTYDADVMSKKILKISEEKLEITVLGSDDKKETIKMK